MDVVISSLSTIGTGICLFILQNVIRENKKLRDDRKKDDEEKEDSLKEGVRCLLMIKLIEYHDKYMKQGSIPSYAYGNFVLLYEAYKKLDGNGLITKYKQDVDGLEII